MGSDSEARLAAPTKDCDLIMKGGVTSGVVYPGAVWVIGQEFRLRNIGGTSAGALATVIAAAAEYRRQISPGKDDFSGFELIHKMPKELGGKLGKLFVPSPGLGSLLMTARALMTTPVRLYMWIWMLWAIFRAHWWICIPVLVLWTWISTDWLGLGWALVTGALGALLAGVLMFADAALRRLPKADFGICPGILPKIVYGLRPKEALGEWLHSQVQTVAGLPLNRPLTVGDLARAGGADGVADRAISVAAMTTDLSSQRPYKLPLAAPIHWFREDEMARVVPPEILTYLTDEATKMTAAWNGDNHNFFRLKVGDAFPVWLVARMSLSFPGLIAAVPLYRYVDAAGDGKQPGLARCLFTDGGLSSNFPVHFFDSTLPRRPTFGIALGSVSAELDAAPSLSDDLQVQMPPTPSFKDWTAPQSYPASDLPARDVRSIGSFGMAMLDTAKDWQDTLQSRLPGFRERIVHVRLKRSEGGLNLSMRAEVIERLSRLGELAGKKLIGFDFNEHRKLRALVALPQLKDSCASIGRAFSEGPEDSRMRGLFDMPYETPAGAFDSWRANELLDFAEALVRDGESLPPPKYGLPHVDAATRVVAHPDFTVPVASPEQQSGQ